MIVADTDVLIDFLRGASPMGPRVGEALAAGRLVTTSITAFELWVGARGKRKRDAIETLLAALDVVPLDEECARRAADVRRELMSRGIDIGMADSLIAGICLVRGGALLTRNRRHYDRVPGLMLAEM
jgi:predicted nucleic acid-binding protein